MPAHRPTFLNPFFSFSARKKRTVSIFHEKKESNVPTVVLNLTQKISAIIRPLRQSLPSERSLRSAHRLSAEPRSKTNTCGPMSTRKGQAASVTLLRREQLRSASAPTNSIVDFLTSIRRKSRARLWSSLSFSSPGAAVLFFLRIEKEKNGGAKKMGAHKTNGLYLHFENGVI